MTIYEKLTKVQEELKAPKSQFNTFGKFYYRNCEDILEALKPLLVKHKLFLMMSDSVELVGDRYYIKATCTITDGDISISNSAYAREEYKKDRMDESQSTGSSSSYARKYALNGLFLIDDIKDPDTDEYQRQEKGNTTKQTSRTSAGSGKADKLVTESQLSRLYAIGGSKGYSKADIDKSIHKKGKNSAKELTMAEYDELIVGIENAPVKGAK
jgi:hypothetical protein